MKALPFDSTGSIPPAVTQERNAALAEITQLHGEIVAAARTSLDKAVRIGELLAEVKAKTPHGRWQDWLASELPFTARTATNYMAIWRNRGKLKSETISDLTAAYRLLEAPRPVKPAPRESKPPAVSTPTPAPVIDVHAEKPAPAPVIEVAVLDTGAPVPKPAGAESPLADLDKSIAAVDAEIEQAQQHLTALQTRRTGLCGERKRLLMVTPGAMVCPECGEVFKNGDDAVTLYECGECSTIFSEEDTDSNRCPDCNKFAGKFADCGCPECHEAELEPAAPASAQAA